VTAYIYFSLASATKCLWDRSWLYNPPGEVQYNGVNFCTVLFSQQILLWKIH